MKKIEAKIAKHSALISMSNKITTVQRKGFNALLFYAKKQLKINIKTFKFQVNVGELLKTIGLGKRNGKYLQQYLHKLQTVIIEYNILQKDNEEWGSFPLLAGVGYKKGIITYSFPHQILDTILEPRIYAYLDLIVIRSLHSKYSIVMYEVLRDYENLRMPKITIEKFRNLMGVEKNKYKEFFNLRARIILPAVKEINENENINFKIKVDYFKQGRAVTDIKFFIEEKKKKVAKSKIAPAVRKPAISDRSGTSDPELQLRPGFENLKGLKALVEQSLRENGEKYTERNIAYANLHAKTNYAAFLKKAISEDWAEAAGTDKKKKQEKEKKDMEKIIERSKQSLRKDMENLSSNSLQNLADRGNEVAKEILNSRVKGVSK